MIYAHRIGRDDARIDWSSDATAIERQVRAFDPVPGAATVLRGAPFKIWQARVAPTAQGVAPGTVVSVSARAVVVACGQGALALEEVQPAGGRRMSVAAFVAGRGVDAGERLGA